MLSGDDLPVRDRACERNTEKRHKQRWSEAGGDAAFMLITGVDAQLLQCAAHVTLKPLSGKHSEPLPNLLYPYSH